MEIFISWSGARSKQVAEALRDWLPNVLQAVKPYVSIDIDKGARWSQDIGERLNKTDFGILCLTRENLGSQWLHFEAGALAKHLPEARVCTFLIDVKPSDISWPLAQFQATGSDEADVFRLLTSLNGRLKESLPETKLVQAFDMWWPRLAELIEAAQLQGVSESLPDVRSERQLLDELVDIARGLQRQLAGIKGQQVPAWLQGSRLIAAIEKDSSRTPGEIMYNETWEVLGEIFLPWNYLPKALELEPVPTEPRTLRIRVPPDQQPEPTIVELVAHEMALLGFERVEWAIIAHDHDPDPDPGGTEET